MTKRNITQKTKGRQPSVKVGDYFTSAQGDVVKVIEYISNKKVLIEYQDEYEYKTYVTTGNLKKGSFKNPYRPNIYGVGFFGVGDFKGFGDGRPTPEYDAWHSMMSRCYNKKVHKKQPSYADCFVDKRWHNFQVFAEWYTGHEHYGLDYHLDKDLLVAGNKTYSPETCSLVPAQINSLIGKNQRKKGGCPAGVSYHKAKKKYIASVGHDGKNIHIGAYNCPVEARKAYLEVKKRLVREKALEWEGKIRRDIFNALMNWTAEI